MSLIKSYTEDGFIPPNGQYLLESDYANAIQSLVVVCTDVVIIDRAKKLIYLAYRKAKPMNSYWWIGGRMKAGETKEESAIRCVMRETGVDLSQESLSFVALLDFRFKDRQQIPQTISCHTLSYVFSVELTAEEIASAALHLDTDEYESDISLQGYTREELVSKNVFPAVLDVYDTIFQHIA